MTPLDVVRSVLACERAARVAILTAGTLEPVRAIAWLKRARQHREASREAAAGYDVRIVGHDPAAEDLTDCVKRANARAAAARRRGRR